MHRRGGAPEGWGPGFLPASGEHQERHREAGLRAVCRDGRRPLGTPGRYPATLCPIRGSPCQPVEQREQRRQTPVQGAAAQTGKLVKGHRLILAAITGSCMKGGGGLRTWLR
jgi:hypothetical protein